MCGDLSRRLSAITQDPKSTAAPGNGTGAIAKRYSVPDCEVSDTCAKSSATRSPLTGSTALNAENPIHFDVLKKFTSALPASKNGWPATTSALIELCKANGLPIRKLNEKLRTVAIKNGAPGRNEDSPATNPLVNGRKPLAWSDPVYTTVIRLKTVPI